MSKQKKIKVGFDLDGVLLYNPFRVIRPIVSYFKKKHFIHRRQMQFYVPKKKWEILFWRLAHWTSCIIAPGYKEIVDLIKSDKIEAYVITGRFKYLKSDFQWWLKMMKAHAHFTEAVCNEENCQPHLFKEQMIKKYKLDVYVEDNYDIVKYLSKSFAKDKVRIVWMYNFFDRHLEHPYRCQNLDQLVDHLTEYINL